MCVTGMTVYLSVILCAFGMTVYPSVISCVFRMTVYPSVISRCGDESALNEFVVVSPTYIQYIFHFTLYIITQMVLIYVKVTDC